jgi:integrase
MNTQTAITTAGGFDYSAIDRADLQPTTKAKYSREIEALLLAGVNPDNHKDLQDYADGLKSSRKQFLKSALRLITQGYEQDIKANVTPANIGAAQAAIMRLDAMRGAVIVPQHKGTKAHTWLSPAEVKQITALCELDAKGKPLPADDLTGKRDWIILGLLLGAGLRREELAALTFDAMKSQPTKNGARTVLQVKGKGAKDRVIPINATLAARLHDWKQITGGGMIARAMVRKSKSQLAGSMSAVAIFQLVAKYGGMIGKPGLAPHDLRRTYAQLGYNAGVPITQISVLLGHSSVKTTQNYLNLNLDLETTASDFIPLAG